MIRIDEIYDNTFWPYIEKNIPNTAMLYHDPFGCSDPDSIHGYPRKDPDHLQNYIYLFPWPFLCIIINVNIMKMGGIYTRNRLVYNSTYKNLIVFNHILDNCFDNNMRN